MLECLLDEVAPLVPLGVMPHNGIGLIHFKPGLVALDTAAPFHFVFENAFIFGTKSSLTHLRNRGLKIVWRKWVPRSHIELITLA
jgi:hypothetical protein